MRILHCLVLVLVALLPLPDCENIFSCGDDYEIKKIRRMGRVRPMRLRGNRRDVLCEQACGQAPGASLEIRRSRERLRFLSLRVEL